MDLLEIEIGNRAGGQPLTIELQGDATGSARFGVQVWKLMDDGTGPRWQPHLSAVAPAEALKQEAEGGRLGYYIPHIDTTEFNRLALIIVRLDGEEDSDPVGAYTVVLHPGP
jgi:hypothetical protein